MKIKKVFIAAAVIIVIIVGFVIMRSFGQSSPAGGTKDLYYCPMHPNFTSDKPGECAICGMSLVKRQTSKSACRRTGKKENTILQKSDGPDSYFSCSNERPDGYGLCAGL